jgi:hypothetical protein
MPIELIPQSTDVAGGSNAQLLKALQERRKLADLMAAGGGRAAQTEKAPAFAPQNAGQAAFGYAGVAANALGDRMIVEREKQTQAERIKVMAESLGAVPGMEKLSLGARIGIIMSDPEAAAKALLQHQAAQNKNHTTFGQTTDAAGNKKDAWIDPRSRTIDPVTQPGAAPAPAGAPGPFATTAATGKPYAPPPRSAGIAPAPPGANTEEWAKLQTKREFAEQAGAKNKQTHGNVVMQDIDRALGKVKDAWIPTTGPVGSVAQYLPGTNAHDVQNLITTIKANAGFEQLQQMRASSPTGAALGPVSDTENKLLQSTIGSLEQSQSERQFKENLMRVRKIYNEVVNGPGAEEPSPESAPSTSAPTVDDLLKKYGPQ